MHPFFSIIIPCYNRGHFLPATIKSVLKQDFINFEIIVVDDGSTDNTPEIIKSLKINDSRIKYFSKSNEERAAARNFGIRESLAPYLVFLDSDDEFLNGHLSHLHELIHSKPEFNFYATKFDFKENEVIFKAPIDNLTEGIYSYEVLRRGNPFACNVCIKKNNPGLRLFKENREFSGMEDWIFLFSNTWSQDLFLSGQTTVRMNEHPNRSMRFNKLIIEKRLLATKFILNNFALQKFEAKNVTGYTDFFCAIHAYLDNEKKQTFLYLMKAAKSLGLKKNIISLLLKIIFGKKIVGKLKEVVSHK